MAARGPQDLALYDDSPSTLFHTPIQQVAPFDILEYDLPIPAEGYGGRRKIYVPTPGEILTQMVLVCPGGILGLSRIRVFVDDQMLLDCERLYLHLRETLRTKTKSLEAPYVTVPIPNIPRINKTSRVYLEVWDAVGDLTLLYACVHCSPADVLYITRTPQQVIYETVQDCDAVIRPQGTVTDVDLSRVNAPTRALVVVVYAEPVTEPFAYLPDIEAMQLDFGPQEFLKKRPGSAFDRDGNSVYVIPFGLPDLLVGYSGSAGHMNFAVVKNPRLRVYTAPKDVVRRIKVFALLTTYVEAHPQAGYRVRM